MALVAYLGPIVKFTPVGSYPVFYWSAQADVYCAEAAVWSDLAARSETP